MSGAVTVSSAERRGHQSRLFPHHPDAVNEWFRDLPPERDSMEAVTESILVSEQLRDLGYEVILAD
jgi:hypothetical protein